MSGSRQFTLYYLKAFSARPVAVLLPPVMRASLLRANEYRTKAADLRERARFLFLEDRELAAEFMRLAEAYTRLADAAERNSATDLIYEPPPPKLDNA